MNRLARILVAVDGSACADKAFECASELSKDLDSRLYAICVVHVPLMLGADKETVRAIEQQLQIEAQSTLSRYSTLAKSRHGIEIETIVALGRPPQVIINTSKEKDIDLIMIGSKGLSGIKGLFLGSVSHDVVRMAKQPVLVVR